jgi:hypothetical protein
MAGENTEVLDLKDVNSVSKTDDAEARQDLSRQAWDDIKGTAKTGGEKAEAPKAAEAPKPETNERGGVIARDAQGNITRVDYPDGVTYEYGKFDSSGKAGRIKITDHKTGDFGQWNKEGDGLWRSYNKDKPNHEVLVGEWRVDNQGVMKMDGQQDSRPLPPKDTKGYTEQPGAKLSRDDQGRITERQDSHGVKYQYSDFDANGQPTHVKITQRGSKEFGEWIKERDGLWRAHHNGKPTSEVIVGEWRVNEKGEMRHDGHQDMQPVSSAPKSDTKTGAPGNGGDKSRESDKSKDSVAPVEAPPVKVETNERGGTISRDAGGRITRVDYKDGVTYEYGKFDANGQPTRIKITDHKDGEFGQWNKEADGLWRSYNKDKPNYEVVVGEWKVDQQGIMHMDGRQDSRPLPEKDNKGYTEQPSSKITRDADGHISQVEHPNGVKYQYSNFDENGQPTKVKITQRGSSDYGEWIKERDGLWRAHHNGKPTSEVIVGEWRVNEKGEMRHDGHQDMQPVERTANRTERKPEAKPVALTKENFPDGHAVGRYPDGKLGQVDYPPGPDGKSRSLNLKYDAKGELSEMKQSDGSKWKKGTDGKWAVRLPDGTKGATFDNVSVDDKGTLTYGIKADGYTFTKAADGTSTNASEKDGTLIKFDSKERPIESTNKTGTRKFEFNDKSELTAVTHADGTKFVKDGADSWKEFGKDGKETGKVWKGKVDTDFMGGLVYKEAGKDETISEFADGTKYIEKNGSGVEVAPDGHVKAVNNPNGKRSEFKYGPDGKVNEMKLPGGTVYKTEDGKTWTNVETGESRELKVEVSSDGRYMIEGNGKKAIMWPDGEISHEDPATGETTLRLLNGTQRVFAKDSFKPAKIKTPEGRELNFDSSDEASYEVRSGDTLSLIARDLLVANNTTDQKYQPSKEEVAQAVQEIVSANAITNANVIARGRKLKIPAKLAS